MFIYCRRRILICAILWPLVCTAQLRPVQFGQPIEAYRMAVRALAIAALREFPRQFASLTEGDVLACLMIHDRPRTGPSGDLPSAFFIFERRFTAAQLQELAQLVEISAVTHSGVAKHMASGMGDKLYEGEKILLHQGDTQGAQISRWLEDHYIVILTSWMDNLCPSIWQK